MKSGEAAAGGVRAEEDLLPTRASLLHRLKDLDDREGWQAFFDAYWRLVFNVARRAGLDAGEAQELVQETFVGVAKAMPGFSYDPGKGSFRGWLLTTVRSRIADHWRRRGRLERRQAPMPEERETGTAWLERQPESGEAAASFESIWQGEWESHVMRLALERTKAKVSARQFLMFDLAALKETPMGRITRTLGVNAAQVYLARHRVGRVLKGELERLRRDAEGSGGL